MKLYLQPSGLQRAAAEQELEACNAASRPFGLALTAEDVQALAIRRSEALRETERIEFGHGILRELVAAFASSPYLSSGSYTETLGELQDLFYHFKGESDEALADTDLVDAMRQVFDLKAHGSLELLEGYSVEALFEAARRAGQDANEDWSEADAYEKGEEAGAGDPLDELDRVFDDGSFARPGELYAKSFYEEYRDSYRIRGDSEGRIGGSSMG